MRVVGSVGIVCCSLSISSLLAGEFSSAGEEATMSCELGVGCVIGDWVRVAAAVRRLFLRVRQGERDLCADCGGDHFDV